MPLSKIAAAAMRNYAIAQRCQESAEERLTRLQTEKPVPVSLVHWRLANAGRPSPEPTGTHLFILRGSPRVCAASFSDFKRGDPLWFERGVVAWAPLPEVPAALTPAQEKGETE